MAKSNLKTKNENRDQEIRKLIFDLGGKALWQSEVGPITHRFYLEAFVLRGKVIILQSWPDGGFELYAPVDDTNRIEPTLVWLEEHAKSKREECPFAPDDCSCQDRSFPESHNMVDAYLAGRDGEDQ